MTVYHPLNDEQDETRERRNAVNNPRQLWPGGILPYEIAPTFTSKILNALRLDIREGTVASVTCTLF